MTGQELQNKCKESLHNKRIVLKNLLSMSALQEDEDLPFRYRAGSIMGVTQYAYIVEQMTWLDLALKRGHWESADEFSDGILGGCISAHGADYKCDRRCAKIVYHLLEEYNV